MILKKLATYMYNLGGWTLHPVYKFYEHRLEKKVRRSPIPESVGFIIDGNRRYADDRGMDREEGYILGGEKADETLRWCLSLGTRHVYVYGFSKKNRDRSPEGVAQVFTVIERKLKELKNDPVLEEYDVKVNFLGDVNGLPDDIKILCQELEEKTKAHIQRTLNIALNYDGQDEIVRAIKKMIEVGEQNITTETFDNYLDTKGRPHPDLILRTSGEERLSGFLLWQSAYSELVFQDVFWPGFRKIDLLRAYRIYQQRQRRFGR